MTPRKKRQDPTPEPTIETVAQSEPAPTADSEDASLPASPPVLTRMVAFHLADQRYGFPIESVQEIQQIVALAQIPDETGVVLGLINLRGSVVPAIDLRLLLGMQPIERTLETPMVICRSASGLVAFIVDGVDDVTELPEGCLQPPPQMHSLSGRMLGVCRLEEGMVFLFDVDRILEPVDLDVCGEVKLL